MSSSYFVDLLKHDTGKTFHEYVQFKRIEIAKNWLTKTDKSILQIANGLGFSSSRYFGRRIQLSCHFLYPRIPSAIT